MKKGFTLAESLVTLAVIGIIALLTVPNMVSSYHKKVQYTKFTKMFNTLTTALDVAEARYKKPDKWPFDKNNPAQTSKDIIYPQLNVEQICEAQGSEKCADYLMTNLTASDEANASIFMQNKGRTVFLKDGTILAVLYDYSAGEKIDGITFVFDTNGKEDPNIVGRDIFIMYYVPQNGKWDFLLNGEHYGAEECDTSNPASTGQGCPSRLIDEGEMKY